ncbi:MAG: 4-hydroxythreonine-4-phosphate dehydrogenase PdxA [Bacteroidota bacterium]|nr:4-hydroxythreonine-4-phosphate dehydrogenase PdxA [Bacteroidota bacterium]
MSMELQKPIIGFSSGDINGIGLEIIIKALSNTLILEMCVPVIFASQKSILFYKKTIPENNIHFGVIKDFTKLPQKQISLFSCWEEDIPIEPGQLTDNGGKYAWLSLQQATQALKDGHIQGLVTAPIHKKNIQSEAFTFTGHTPFLKSFFGVEDVVMILAADNMRVAPLTEHVPVKDIVHYVTKENILRKLKILTASLQKDFDINKPKIAVLGLNPHAGDEGLIGSEEETIIKPAIKEAKQNNMMVFGPYSADAFFARGTYTKFDAVLAMYHDQGLIPFKSLATGDTVNYTAGLPAVRTSPDHGTAFDIAGKGMADASSMMSAIFNCIDIIRRRNNYEEAHSNPVRRMSGRILANAEDERVEGNL